MIGIVDCETTGLTAGYHEIIQISIVPVIDMQAVGRWISYIKPSRPGIASPEAMKVNGLDLKELEKAPTLNQVRGSLREWMENFSPNEKIQPLGQNYLGFDRDFLTVALGKETYDKYFSRRVRDTSILALSLVDKGKIKLPLNKYGEPSVSLDNLANFFGIKRSAVHDAYEDCLVTLAIYKRMLDLI